MTAGFNDDLLFDDLLEEDPEASSLFDNVGVPLSGLTDQNGIEPSDSATSLTSQFLTDDTSSDPPLSSITESEASVPETIPHPDWRLEESHSHDEENHSHDGENHSHDGESHSHDEESHSHDGESNEHHSPFEDDHGISQDDALPVARINYVDAPTDVSFDTSLFDQEIDLSETFFLHSNEGAAHTIYLDFDGHETTHWAWTRHNNNESIVTEAFDIDGNSSAFSDAELERIQFIWQRVAEDFIPFDVNVTTFDPGVEALQRTSTDDDAWGMRVVIGRNDWLNFNAGGVAYRSTFAYSEDVPAFVFTNSLGNGNEKFVAEAASHEIGHTLGLNHDGQGDAAYYQGHRVGNSGWAPLLGASYYQELTQWSQGEYVNATEQQDDLAIITSQNGFGYRLDDHENSFENATYLSGIETDSAQFFTISSAGIIEQNTDSDFFRFHTGDGQVSLEINPALRGPNLDILANLYDQNYELIATSNSTDTLSASFELNLSAGDYFLEIDGVGQGDPQNGGYSDYGSLGQYTIEGTVQQETLYTISDYSPLVDEVDAYARAGADVMTNSAYDYVAVQNGSWFEASTWANGQVPSDGANVYIPENITVLYDGESDVRLGKVSLSGNLVFAHDQDTKILVDTIMGSETSTLTIGTHDNPVDADVQTQIIIDSQSAVSDEAQLEKGLVSMGTVSIYGADKLDFVALQDAFAGDNTLTLDLPENSTEPLGWQVGDRLVLGGTDYNSNGNHADNSKFQDEVLIITAINGNEISFINENITSGDNTILRFDHVRPKNFEDQVDIYVANTTRNISISSENGATTPNTHRGHVMFMHSNNVRVFNAGFYDLGRTDKNRLIDDVGTNLDGSTGTGTNVRGRYSVHFHHVGVNHGDDQHSGGGHGDGHHTSSSGQHGAEPGGIASGNAIVGSPGWGLVHHNSHATFEDNVVFDVVGSGIVSEGGAETGNWHNNITIKTTGDSDPHHGFGHSGPRVQNFDLGFNGEGYWVQGAGQVVMTDNIAVSAAGAGLIVFGGGDGGASVRDQHTIAVSNLPEEWQDIGQGFGDGSVVDVATVPLRLLSGFEAYNVDDGILTWGTLLNGDGQHTFDVPGAHAIDTVVPAHDYRATVDDFKLWQVRQDGVQLWYSSQYDLSNGLVLANESIHPFGRGTGLANNGKNHTFTNLHVEGFQIGAQLPNDGTDFRSEFRHRDISASILEDSYISGVRTNFANFGDDAHYFEVRNSTFGDVALENNNQLPVAAFEVESIGGLAYEFDGAESFDPDPWSNYSQFETRGIISWAWDFDSDGVIDDFGRFARHRFDEVGEHDVTLTVWDQDGVSTSLTQTLDVQVEADQNVFLNGDFSINQANDHSRGSSLDANIGWSLSGARLDTAVGDDGALVLSQLWRNSSGAVQVIEDDFIRQGLNRLSVTLTNTDGNQRVDQQNVITVSLFGINGQFENRASDRFNAPQQVGALPFESTELLNVDLGGSNYDWQTFDFDINLGSGFEYLVAEINTLNAGQSGDFIAIDSFALTGNSLPRI